MANNLVLMERSAMPMRMKRVCLTQETIRILRNTKKELPETVKNKLLSEFSSRMRDSGYSDKMRREVIESGVKGYEKQVSRDEIGECPLHRPKGYMNEERQKQKQLNRNAWYRPFDTVLFCPPTPKGQLAKQLRAIAHRTSEEMPMKIKIVEKAGISMKTLLPGLQITEKCQNNNNKTDCFIHKNDGRGNCRTENVVYKSTCLDCAEKGPDEIPEWQERRLEKGKSIKSIYIGETSRSAYQRGKQHVHAIKYPKKHKKNAFAKHAIEYHKGRKGVRYKTDVIGTFKRPM